MRVPLGWLSEWIDLPASHEGFKERLTLGGLEIEGEERTGPDLSDFRVGLVTERKPHPNADRLSVCRVDPGNGEPVEVVCGAPNVAAGQKVVLANPGSVLPDGTKLKKAKIRGVTSHGMICSTKELGIGEDHEGILVLDPDAPVGHPASEVVRAGQIVLDFEITPNRGDWASMLGMAREVRAHFGGTLRIPACEPSEDGRKAAEDISVEIEDREGCYRYLARVVRGVRLGPSPRWLCEKLEAAGMRPINVVVDVTNLVLLEFGQPLHAFDLATLRGARICVRRAREGERIVTLDGQTRELVTDDLVIADAASAVALAGVMGGAETEVQESTCDILIESAHFDPLRVRRTARRLGLHSESSYRFERGVDRKGIKRAADRAALLLAELAGGTVSRGVVEALGAELPVIDEVVLDPARVNRLLGTRISTEEVVALLSRLEIRGALDSDGKLRCRVPSFRNDIRIPEDLVEEVARIHGYDRIPTTLPVSELTGPARPRSYLLADRARDSFCSSGLLETRSFPGISASDLDALRLSGDDSRRATVSILNPLVESESLLRTTLVPSLLRATRRNLAHQTDRVRLFEISHVFIKGNAAGLPGEPSLAAAVLTRGERASLWEPTEPPPLFFEARGIAERTLADLGVQVRFHPFDGAEAAPYLHPGVAGQLLAGGDRVATVGELHPEVAARFEIDVPCAIIELDLAAVEGMSEQPRQYVTISRQPTVRRDIAVLLERACPAGEVLESIRKSGGSALVSAELFDRYEGKGVPEGKVSLAFRLIFQRPDRALRESEIKGMTERVVQTLAHRFGGELR
jgi:phenylalanyl-tRNA synthetase beta chain